jgi:hypothetical protein
MRHAHQDASLQIGSGAHGASPLFDFAVHEWKTPNKRILAINHSFIPGSNGICGFNENEA